MARTIRTKVYKFNELSEDAKETAIRECRKNGFETDYIYENAQQTVEKFNDVFGTTEGARSWLDVSFNSIDDNVLNLRGLRLRTYIINNFWSDLFKGKYFSLWSKTEITYKHYPNGHPVLKTRYSKVLFDNGYTLTGMSYDMCLLLPIYDFLEWRSKPDYYSYMDFETLVLDCFQSLSRSIDNEIDYQHSPEVIAEDIVSNDMEFTKEGKLFNR